MRTKHLISNSFNQVPQSLFILEMIQRKPTENQFTTSICSNGASKQVIKVMDGLLQFGNLCLIMGKEVTTLDGFQ
jgi:hypothetical protein